MYLKHGRGRAETAVSSMYLHVVQLVKHPQTPVVQSRMFCGAPTISMAVGWVITTAVDMFTYNRAYMSYEHCLCG